MTYDAHYFYRFFSWIDESKWCTNSYDNGEGQHCALGHCGQRGVILSDIALSTTTGRECSLLFGGVHRMADVNDGRYDWDELGSTPKERILNFLQLQAECPE